MQLLSKQFTHDGRTLKQLARSDKAALYELIGYQGLTYGFEVVRIRIQKQREQFGRTFGEREAYPASSQFGYIAWSYGCNYRRQAFERYGRYVQPEHQSLHATSCSELQGYLGREQPRLN
jgi:hypothetical protein